MAYSTQIHDKVEFHEEIKTILKEKRMLFIVV